MEKRDFSLREKTMSLDTNYSASKQEKDYVQESLEKKGVEAFFSQEKNNLKEKIIRNFHTENFVNFEKKHIFDAEKAEMKAIIHDDQEFEKTYLSASEKNKTKGGFSEGILMLQAIAIKCVNILANQASVEAKLKSRNDIAYRSQAMDGILGPNTFYVLASIAKEQGLPFNGIADQALVQKMISICKTPEQKQKDTKTEQQEDQKQEQEKKEKNIIQTTNEGTTAPSKTISDNENTNYSEPMIQTAKNETIPFKDTETNDKKEAILTEEEKAILLANIESRKPKIDQTQEDKTPISGKPETFKFTAEESNQETKKNIERKKENEKKQESMKKISTKEELSKAILMNENILFENKNKENRRKERMITIIAIGVGYDELFNKFDTAEKEQKIEEIERKKDEQGKDTYEYGYYNSLLKTLKEKLQKEIIEPLEKAEIEIVDPENHEEKKLYSLKKENDKNKIIIMNPTEADGTKYKLMVIKGQWSPISELKGEQIDKTIFEIRIKEDGKTVAQENYKSFQEDETGYTYTFIENKNNKIIFMKKKK